MKVIATALVLLLAARAAHADASVEATGGVLQAPALEGGHIYAPHVTLSGGTRIDPHVVVGLRLSGFYMHQPTIHHGDTSSAGFNFLGVIIGPAVKAEPKGPLWAGVSVGLGVGRQSDLEEDGGMTYVDYALGLEARVGVTLFRSDVESVALSLALTAFVADGLAFAPSAALGYQFN